MKTLPSFIAELLATPPRAHEGVHNWLFRVARQLHAHLPAIEIITILENKVANCGRPVPRAEIVAAVQNSVVCAWRPAQGSPVKLTAKWPPVNQEQWEAIVRGGGGLADLWELSTPRIEDADTHAEAIIDRLFPGNPLLCCGKTSSVFDTRPRESWRGELTLNGSSAVGLNLGNANGNGFNLATSIASGSGYTVFAYVEPSNATGRHAFTGGSSLGALEWDIYNGKDDFEQEYMLDIGHGTATVPTTSFSEIDLAVNAGYYFNFNGSADGSAPGAAFGSPITRIGNNEGGGDGFAGYIAEIDIYEGILTAPQISTVESQLSASYIAPVPEPSTWAMMAGGFALLFAARRFRQYRV